MNYSEKNSKKVWNKPSIEDLDSKYNESGGKTYLAATESAVMTPGGLTAPADS